MRAELEKALYGEKISRREFLKAVGVAGVAVSTGCVDIGKYLGRETPAPKKRFTPELRIEGDEEFKRNVENMLRVLKEYSPEWYEKTMYAGEVVRPGHPSPTGSKDGTITLSPDLPKLGYDVEKNVTKILMGNENFVHEVQHVIDDNTYWLGREVNGKRDDILLVVGGGGYGVETELRAGIADFGDYQVKVGLKNEREAYEFIVELFNERRGQAEEKYKGKLDVIEQTYFDHQNKKLKTEFLNESWQQFKSL